MKSDEKIGSIAICNNRLLAMIPWERKATGKIFYASRFILGAIYYIDVSWRIAGLGAPPTI